MVGSTIGRHKEMQEIARLMGALGEVEILSSDLGIFPL